MNQSNDYFCSNVPYSNFYPGNSGSSFSQQLQYPSAPLFTSSPRPAAKTSLGFYTDLPVYDNVSDDEEEELTGTSNSSGTSGSEESAHLAIDEDRDKSFEQHPHLPACREAASSQQQPVPMPPPLLPQNFSSGSLPSFQQGFQGVFPPQRNNLNNIPLDQQTLQQLMVNPELLRQLNEASARLMATKISAKPMPQPYQQQMFFPSHYPQSNRVTVNGITAAQPPFIKPPLQQLHQMNPMPSTPGAPLALVNHQRYDCNNGLLKIASPLKPTLPRYQPQYPYQRPPSAQGGGLAGKICIVCGDDKVGYHYGVTCCFACMDFFRRRVVNAAHGRAERRQFSECVNKMRACIITKETRNNCKFCRYSKCLQVGMKIELVNAQGLVKGRRCQSALPPMMD